MQLIGKVICESKNSHNSQLGYCIAVLTFALILLLLLITIFMLFSGSWCILVVFCMRLWNSCGPPTWPKALKTNAFLHKFYYTQLFVVYHSLISHFSFPIYIFAIFSHTLVLLHRYSHILRKFSRHSAVFSLPWMRHE